MLIQLKTRIQIPQPFTLWGHTIAVDWAEPELEVDDDIMQQVSVAT